MCGWHVDQHQGGCLQWPNMDNVRVNKMNSVMEVISWVCAYFQEDHDWFSGSSLPLQEGTILEALNSDIDVAGVVQMLYAVGFLRQVVSTMAC